MELILSPTFIFTATTLLNGVQFFKDEIHFYYGYGTYETKLSSHKGLIVYVKNYNGDASELANHIFATLKTGNYVLIWSQEVALRFKINPYISTAIFFEYINDSLSDLSIDSIDVEKKVLKTTNDSLGNVVADSVSVSNLQKISTISGLGNTIEVATSMQYTKPNTNYRTIHNDEIISFGAIKDMFAHKTEVMTVKELLNKFALYLTAKKAENTYLKQDTANSTYAKLISTPSNVDFNNRATIVDGRLDKIETELASTLKTEIANVKFVDRLKFKQHSDSTSTRLNAITENVETRLKSENAKKLYAEKVLVTELIQKVEDTQDADRDSLKEEIRILSEKVDDKIDLDHKPNFVVQNQLKYLATKKDLDDYQPKPKKSRFITDEELADNYVLKSEFNKQLISMRKMIKDELKQEMQNMLTSSSANSLIDARILLNEEKRNRFMGYDESAVFKSMSDSQMELIIIPAPEALAATRRIIGLGFYTGLKPTKGTVETDDVLFGLWKHQPKWTTEKSRYLVWIFNNGARTFSSYGGVMWRKDGALEVTSRFKSAEGLSVHLDTASHKESIPIAVTEWKNQLLFIAKQRQNQKFEITLQNEWAYLEPYDQNRIMTIKAFPVDASTSTAYHQANIKFGH